MSDCFPSLSPGKPETHAQHNDIGMVLPRGRVDIGNPAKRIQSEDLSWSQAQASWGREKRRWGRGVPVARLTGSKVRVETGFAVYPLSEGKLAK